MELKGDSVEPIHGIVLVDVAEGGGKFEAEVLRGMGHPVVVCHGPEPKTLCPILRKGGSCALVDQAHGIVFELDLDRAQHRAILRRYQEVVRDDVPIRVLVSSEQAERYRELLSGVEIWTDEPGVGDLDAFSARIEAAERVTEAD
ncbi:MAG: hypothetical protein ACE5MM_08660 [Nitrospiraceae bacterium]